jgi:hypothetical protein
MNRITIADEVAERLRRFPTTVDICDEKGNTLWTIERVDPPGELPEASVLSDAEIKQTLHDIFAER